MDTCLEQLLLFITAPHELGLCHMFSWGVDSGGKHESGVVGIDACGFIKLPVL